MVPSFRVIAVCLFLTPALPAADEPRAALVPGESKTTASRLGEAERYFRAGKWSAGLEALQGVLDTAGDDLAPIDPSHSVRARWLVHRSIAALPPAELQRYRQRVDVQARRWLDQGAANRDAALLRRVVDEAFCSQPAERALELSGDLDFELGRFAQAAAWWSLLLPDGAVQATGGLAYPGPVHSAARVRAKQLMALHFQGLTESRDRHFETFVAHYGSESGVLAGMQGKYSDILAKLFAVPAPRPDDDLDWTTFAGDASRGRIPQTPLRLLDRLSILCRSGPAIRVSLPNFSAADEAAFDLDRANDLTKVRLRGEFSRSLSFHPVIASGRLMIADANRIVAFDLKHPSATSQEIYSTGLASPAPHLDQRCTLTVADGYVYARLGNPRVDEKAANVVRTEAKALESRIVCVRLNSLPGEPRVRWIERGITGDNAKSRGKVIFEGAPVVRDGCVYVAATRFEAGKAVTAVHCYSAENARATDDRDTPEPRLLWHTDVCDLRESAGTRYRHHLLTLAGPLVICCTRTGTVVAVDAGTGRRQWAVHSSARLQELDDRPVLTDLTPCLYAANRLYAAPVEGGNLLCIDAESGRILWQRQAIDVVHLLGVGAGRLIFTTPTGLRAVGAEHGGDSEGWSREARTEYGKDGSRSGWSPAGRGLLAGDYILWPAIDPAGNLAVHALRQDTGEPDDNPTLLHRLPAGNLIYADGCMAVAGAEELTVFIPPAWQMSERERGVKAAPVSASAALALAAARADSNLVEPAAQEYARAERLAGRATSLGQVAREWRQRLWLDAGRQALEQQHYGEARDAFARATATDYSSADRAAALLETADACKQRGRLEDAATALNTLLDNDVLREARLNDLARAGDRAGERLRAYALADRTKADADSAFAAAKSPAELDRVARRFPGSSAGRMALEKMALQHEASGRPGAAADAWRRLLGFCESATAYAGLARTYERQGCASAARRAWIALGNTFGDAVLPEIDTKRKVAEAVAERVRSLQSPRAPSLPLNPTWEVTLDPTEDLLPLSGGDLFLTSRRARDSEVIARDIAIGSLRWRAPLPFAATQAFGYADLILVVGREGVIALRREDGGRAWQILPAREDGNLGLNSFRLTGMHLICLQGNRAVLVCDARTGAVERYPPTHAEPGSSIPIAALLPHYVVSRDRAQVQTTAGTVCSLPLEPGGDCTERPTSGDWCSDPVSFGSASVYVEGPRRVVFAGCETNWTYSVPGVTTLTGRPARVAVIGDAILVLVESNIGFQLQRLSPQSGRPLWTRPVLLREPAGDPADWAAGDGTVCLVENDVLTGRSLQDGKVVWQTPLDQPGRSWHVERVANGLLLFPTTTTGRQITLRWLTRRLQWRGAPDTREAIGGGYPVLCCDCNGRMLQRFDFSSRGIVLRNECTDAGGLFLAPSLTVSRGPLAGCLPVQICERGIVVVVGPRARGLIPANAK